MLLVSKTQFVIIQTPHVHSRMNQEQEIITEREDLDAKRNVASVVLSAERMTLTKKQVLLLTVKRNTAAPILFRFLLKRFLLADSNS